MLHASLRGLSKRHQTVAASICTHGKDRLAEFRKMAKPCLVFAWHRDTRLFASGMVIVAACSEVGIRSPRPPLSPPGIVGLDDLDFISLDVFLGTLFDGPIFLHDIVSFELAAYQFALRIYGQRLPLSSY